MAIRDTIKSIWSTIANWFWNKKKEEEIATPTTTTNTITNTNTWATQAPSIVNSNTQGTVLINPNNTSTLDQTIASQQLQSKEKEMDEITNAPLNQSNYYDISKVDNEKIQKALNEREEHQNKNFIGKLWDSIKSLWTFIWNVESGQLADSERQANEEKTYVGYNKDNWDMYELQLNTDGIYWAQDTFNKAYSDFLNTIWQYWENIPDDAFDNAYDEFYNRVNGLFKTSADDRYSDGFIFSAGNANRIWRRKNNFSDEQLNMLAENWITQASSSYVPDKSQLWNYLQATSKNQELDQQLNTKYNLTQDPLELDTSESWRAKEALFNRAMVWVIDAAKQNLNWNVANNFLLNSTEIVNSKIEKAWSVIEPLLEDAELTKLQAQREGRELTDDERRWVQLADNANKALSAFADALNTFVKEHADANWVDADWNITSVKDVFSDWRWLWDIISKPVLEASWLDTQWWQSLWNDKNVSWLDAFQELANQWRFNFSQSRSSTLWKAWDKLDRVVWHVWTALSEVWQQTVGWLMKGYNTYMDLVNWDANRLMWRKSKSKTAEYMNQDFTMWMLINTKETWFTAAWMWQTWSRTARKYLLQAAEYWPEFIGNIVPDILMYSTWIWEAGAFSTLSKVINKAKNLSSVNKAKNALESIWMLKKARGAIEGTKAAAETIWKLRETPNWIRTWLQWLDKGLTNWVIDQLVDAQYSPYDTESYSPESMALSLWGTIGFEIIPWLWKSGAFKAIGNIPWAIRNKSVSELIDGTWWDILEFFSRPENADAINRISNIKFNKSASWLTFDDLRAMRDDFNEMKAVTKKYWDKLQDYQKQGVNQWSKESMYRMLTQVYNLDNNSQVARNIRAIISKDWTNIADMAKYLWWIPWTVEVWPWTSTIKLKNANGNIESRVWSYAVWGTQYNQALDVAVDGWLHSKLQNGFTIQDINNISSIPAYKDINESLFSLADDGKYYITEDWLKRLWIETKDMPLSWVAREINKAEEWQVSNKFKEIMSEIRNSNKQISDDTINLVANSQTYQEVRDKVADVVC